MKNISIGPASPVQMNALIKDLERLGILFEIHVSSQEQDMVPHTDILGLPLNHDKVSINLKQTDFISHLDVFETHGFEIVSKNVESFQQENETSKKAIVQPKLLSGPFSIDSVFSLDSLFWCFFILDFTPIGSNHYFKNTFFLVLILILARWIYGKFLKPKFKNS